MAGGSGTYAFLIGVGRITPQGFRVRQFFMRDFGEEASQLSALTEHLKQFEVLITYNGRTFDQPLLETRFRMARQRPPFSSLEHLDLLFGARRLWNLRFDSCRLVELENQILGVERQGDLPGEMIPYVYFEYVRTHEIFRLMPVFHHNAIDILTLACLTAIVPRAFHARIRPSSRTALKWSGLARWWRQAEQHENALALFRQAVEKNLSDELLFRTLWDIAALEKKLGREHAALPVLTDLAASRNPWRAAAFVELAKYYERRERNYALALEMTRSALELEPSEALQRRAARLEKRVWTRSENIEAHMMKTFLLLLVVVALDGLREAAQAGRQLEPRQAKRRCHLREGESGEHRRSRHGSDRHRSDRPGGEPTAIGTRPARCCIPPAFVLNQERTARDYQTVESSRRRRSNHADRERTGARDFC